MLKKEIIRRIFDPQIFQIYLLPQVAKCFNTFSRKNLVKYICYLKQVFQVLASGRKSTLAHLPNVFVVVVVVGKVFAADDQDTHGQ